MCPTRPNDLIGTSVIAVSNEDEPYLVGKVVGYADLPGDLIPVVEDEEGNRWNCMGIVIPYSAQMKRMLDVMDPQSRWSWLSNIVLTVKVLSQGS